MKKIIALVLVLSALLLTGCGSEETAKKDDGELTIVTSFYPMYIDVINIVGDAPGVKVVNMTKPQTGCLHDYQLTTEDMKTLEKADVFVANGAGMEEFLDKVISEQKNLKVIEAAKDEDIKLIKDAEGDNPHVWTSVTYAIEEVRNITAELVEIDPKNADIYRKNALDYTNKLAELRDEMHQNIDPLPNKNIVTFHEAFPYLAKEFGLKIVAVIEREPGTEPTTAELKSTIEKINASGVKVLFTEPQYSPTAAETIARETGAKIYQLDPIVTGESDNTAKDAYIERMKKNMEVLKEALQ